MKLFHALCVVVILVCLMGFLVLALTGNHKDNLTGPFMGILGVLAVLLSVGITERATEMKPDRDEDPMPKPHPSIAHLYLRER